MPEQLNLNFASSPLDIMPLLLNLAVGVILALALRTHFQRYGCTLSNREEFGQVFPFILLTTILIITVVKSSLALSLGLVGALSIVRFRTPIKEPEELAYLFMAIAMGLGLGANQTLPTVIASLGILGVMAVIGRFRGNISAKSIYLSIDAEIPDDNLADQYLSALTELVSQNSVTSDLRRFDLRGSTLEATFLLDIADNEQLSSLTSELRSTYPNAGVTFLDQNRLPSV